MSDKLFEVPYNFDEALIPFYQKYTENINFLFLPPYKEDQINTRTCIQSDVKGCCYMPPRRDEYENHLQKIVSSGLRFVVLWQDRFSIIQQKMIEYYIDLGASGFIVANDANAKIIKNFNNNLLVICSIVQRQLVGISQKDFSYYDYVVMYYPFNRSLDVVKKLDSIRDKIVIMPNTVCHTDCPAVHHWFPSAEHPFLQDRDCMAMKNIVRCCYIYPEHLRLFDDYVGGYKLQGREYPTDIIEQVCEAFFSRHSPDDLLEYDIDSILKGELEKMSPEEYYNVKSTEIMDII